MAMKTIKGLTVEIGGDTTQLGKALDGVSKKSQNLSTELGEINKLLKMDPGNTDLLAQKQQVLADAVENTAEKLKTLKEAEKQVQKQFERGDVTADQVRALQREIIETEKRLKSYERASKETADEIEKLGKESKDAEKDVDKLGDEAKETGTELDKAGNLAASFGDAASAACSVALKGFAAVLGVVTAAGAALVASAESTRDYRREIGKLETAFTTAGHSTETAMQTYQALQGVLGETDQAVEAANHLAKLTKSEQDLQKWTTITTGVYATFGASLPIEGLTEAANETAKVGQVTGPLADALNWAGVSEDQFNESLAACADEQERQVLIMETLNGLYSDAAEKYQEVNAEIIRANEANEAWTASVAEAGAAVEPILTDVKLLGASLLSDLMPGIVGVTTAFRGLINGEEGSATAFGEALSSMVSNLLGKVVALLPEVVNAAMSLMTSLVTAITGMAPQLMETAMQIVITLLDGLTAAFPLITQAIADMIPQLVAAYTSGAPQVLEGAVQLFLAIVDAVGLILPPLMEAIPRIFEVIYVSCVNAFPELLQAAVNLLMAIVKAIPVLINALLPAIPTIVDGIIKGLLDCMPVLIDGAITLLFGILEAIPEIAAALYESAPSIVASIVKGILQASVAIVKAGVQLMEGLIKGILSYDYMGKLKTVGDGIVKGFKKIFDIHSPSRVMAGIGEMLDEGLAAGIEDNAGAAVDAFGKLSDDMLDEAGALDGLTLERRMNHTFSPSDAATPADGISSKLDRIYQAILRGQVIMLDGKTLVGSTADRYDTELGQRRVLAERGAL